MSLFSPAEIDYVVRQPLRIRPRRILSWGLDGDSYALRARDVA